MAKRQIFYSFHYDNDVFRVQQIRNIGALEENKPVSANEWETVKRGGETSIKKWIDEQLKGTTVTVVLVGENTKKSKWVQYEIDESIKRGNGLLEINISKINALGKGTSGFCGWMLPDKYKGYAWVKNEGYKNLPSWIELAAKAANK